MLKPNAARICAPHFGRIAMPADMRGPDYRSEELIVKGRHLDAALERFGDHGIDLAVRDRCRSRTFGGKPGQTNIARRCRCLRLVIPT